MDAFTIRKKFLDYFEKNGHKIVPSAPIVVKNDPTLMFTNAGMNQFKDFFLGNKKPEFRRLADTQKCLRVSGKHNDLEEVGTDGYHHTMFEMLGNWSIGDYFKEEAIELAWRLLTEEYMIPKDILYVSVFGGDEKENLEPDYEAVEIWKKWIPEDRILFFSKKDNFWEMGDTGPCGPCSEIHVDLRHEELRHQVSGASLVNVGVPEVMEIWNNVFIQYNRKADGSLEELPAKHIDTGMGFERITMVLQKKSASYDTDIFMPMINFISEFSGIKYSAKFDLEAKSDMAMRVLADHIRAVSFAIADGAIPSNTGPGYVIRRILRRAVRYQFSFLGIKEPFLFRLVPILSDMMGHVFPELKAQNEFIVKVIREEEISFLRTLESGLKRIELLPKNNSIISGKSAFELYDTYGFPLDLTKLICRENNWDVDEIGFNEALLEQKARSRSDAKKEYSDWNILREGECSFLGYDQLALNNSELLRWRKIESKGTINYQLVLSKTCFYPEGGGQVGDQGVLLFGKEEIIVIDTVKENDLILHIVENLPTELDSKISMQVNVTRRSLTENNHSATHLLHAALRQVLGTHVHQKGSLVNQDYLRFDFSHFQKITHEEIQKIESIVNEKIRENILLEESRNIPIKEAEAAGAMMLFGEKYGDTVRMITFDPSYSRELCGGCHVKQTGKIAFFKIIAESSVAAGIRRVEAVTSIAAEQYVNERLEELQEVKNLLKNPKDIVLSLNQMFDENKLLQKQIQTLKEEKSIHYRQELIKKSTRHKGIQVLAEYIAMDDSKIIKNMAYQLLKDLEPCILLLGFEENGKAQLMCAVSEDLVSSNSYDANQWLKQISHFIEGGGGGQKFFATAGGKNPQGISSAIDAGRRIIMESIGA
ncbi:MAG: alanine--tRNA ligase [Chitinophagales bacterium]|nr:alanine--tRNA ligase [Chitinophagales bacterium]